MKKYCLVSDDSGHDYVIPAEHRSEWYKFDFSDYDFDLPDWAIMVEGGLEFENPTEDGIPLFGTPKVQVVEVDLSSYRPSSALDTDCPILTDDHDMPFECIEAADDLAELYFPNDVIIRTVKGDVKCKTSRSNAWQPDGQYSYYFV